MGSGDGARVGRPVLARFLRDRSARLGLVVLGVLVVFAVLGPLVWPFDPLASDFTMHRDPIGAPPGSTWVHPLGTDSLFRDLVARLASGARLSLGLASAATAIAVTLGGGIGIAAGLCEGGPLAFVDGALMRLVDALRALPFLLFITAIGAAVGRPDAGTMLLVLGLTGWTVTARIVRDKTLEIKKRDFVVAARALGGGTLHVVQKHVVPNLIGTLLVVGAVLVGQMILAEAVLSYLTLGTQPPQPSWGRMLHEAEPLMATQLVKVAAPGFAILLTVLATSRISEGLRDAFEPRDRGAVRGRRVPFDLLIAAGVLVLVALARPPKIAGPVGLERPEATPVRGGTLRLAISVNLRTLDPALAYDEATSPIEALLFARLATWDAEGRVVPELAERIDLSEDGRTYTFVLRQNVRFHDGAEMRSADVVRSLERTLHPKTPCPAASHYASIKGFEAFRGGKAEHLEGVRAVGDRTVVVELADRDATFLPLMTLSFAAPVCPSMGATVDTQAPATPCGAGPFRLASFEPESGLRLVRHEAYYQPGKPHLDAIEWLTNVLPRTQRYRFEDGSIDVLRELSSGDSARYVADDRWSAFRAWSTKKATNGFFLNTEMAPFDSVAMRRAVAAAVDPSVLPRVSTDIAENDRMLPPSVPGPDRSRRMRTHDLGRALAEMARAGYPFDPATGKGGYPEAIDYITVPDSFQQQEAEVYAQQLAKIGIRLRLRLVPFASYLAEVSRRRTTVMGSTGWGADFPDPSNFFESVLSSKAIHDEGSLNVAFFSNAELDRVLAEAHTESSHASRMALYERAEEIVRDEAPWVPATVSRSLEVRQPYVHGYVPHPILPVPLADVWLDPGGASRRDGREGSCAPRRDACARAGRDARVGAALKAGLVRAASRLAWAVLVVIVVTTLSFLVLEVLPGDPARMLVGPQASEQDAAQARRIYGLDQPFFARYGRFWWRLVHVGPKRIDTRDREHRSCASVVPGLHMDLGYSFTYRKPVVDLLAARIPRSFELAVATFLVQALFGVGLGVLAASRRNTRWDDATLGATALGMSAPVFLVGLLLQYVLAYRLRVLPYDGYGKTAAEQLRSLVLPATTLGVLGVALYARLARDEVTAALGQDFARTARAKGASRARVLVVHALRAAMVPIVTVAALDLGTLIGGAIVTEKLFRWPGVGQMAVDAVLNRDGSVVLGVVLFTSTAVALSTVLLDLVLPLVDPRLSQRTKRWKERPQTEK